MNSEQNTAFLQEHWYIASVLIGAVILIGAIRNWNWLCDPTLLILFAAVPAVLLTIHLQIQNFGCASDIFYIF